jgi:hypothetical protein
MPTYLVTDRTTGIKTMVEAPKPQSAIVALVGDRFVASPALDAASALRLARDGVDFIDAAEPTTEPTPEPRDDVAPITAAEPTASDWDDGDDVPITNGDYNYRVTGSIDEGDDE